MDDNKIVIISLFDPDNMTTEQVDIVLRSSGLDPDDVGNRTRVFVKWVMNNIEVEMDKKPNRLIQFFAYDHLPDVLRDISRPFGELAKGIDANLPDNAEKTTALRKLLEAKDCAVRAYLYKE